METSSKNYALVSAIPCSNSVVAGTSNKTFMLFVLLTVCILSCSKERLEPSNNLITEIRRTDPFNSIHLSGSSPALVTYGPDFKVELKGSDNLVSRFKTTVINNELVLEYDDVNVRKDDIKIYLTMPVIEKISSFGSADIEVSGNFPAQDKFDVTSSGSGNVNVLDPIQCLSSQVDLSGSGNAELEDLIVSKALVKTTGSGSIRITVQDTLKVTISGSGNVYYKGNPTREISISGSGKVIQFESATASSGNNVL